MKPIQSIFTCAIVASVFNSHFIQGNAQPVENESSANSTSVTVGKAKNISTTSSDAPEKVTIYIFNYFIGVPWSLDISNCTNVPPFFYKKTSSIDTHDNCVILFSRENCQGRHIRIAPGTSGHSHLADVNFDDTLVSLERCKDLINSTTATSTEDKPHKRSRRNSQIISFLMQNLGLGGASGTNDDDQSQSDGNNGGGLQSLLSKLNFNNFLSQFQQQGSDGSDDNSS